MEVYQGAISGHVVDPLRRDLGGTAPETGQWERLHGNGTLFFVLFIISV